MMNFFGYRISLVYVFITVVVTTAFLVIGFFRLNIETDILKTLPMNDPVISDAGYIFANHPFNDQLVIDVSIQKDDPDVLVDGGEFVEKKLMKSGLFKSVGTRETQYLIPELIHHVVRNLPTLFTENELEKEIGPLLAPQKMRIRLENSVAELAGIEGIGQAGFISRDPLGLRNIVLARLEHLAPSRNAQIYREQLVSSDWKHLLITAIPIRSGMDTDFSRRITRLINRISREIDQRYEEEGIRFTLTPVGAYRAALDNETAIKKDVGNALFLATLGIALLLIVSFPRPLIGLLSFLPAVCGTVTALFIYSLLHESISLLAVGFGGAIISITVDHGIAYLLFLDRPYETTGREAAREVRSVGLIATLTTVGAFISLSISGFPILSEIGQFAAFGIASSFLFVHTIFPLIFPTMPPARRKKMVLLEKLANWLVLSGGKYKAYAALGFAVVMLFFAKPEFRADLASMNSVTRETIAAENLVTTVWGKILNKVYMMSEAENITELQKTGDRLSAMLDREVASGALSSVFIPSMIFPGEERGKQNFNSWKKFWNQNRTSELKTNIQRISSEIGFSDNAFEPFLSDIDQNEYQETAIPEKFFSLLGISRLHDQSGLALFSSLTPGSSYQADHFFDRFHAAGHAKIFDPNLFSEKLGNLLSHTFLKMMVIIIFSVLFLLFPFFMDWKLTVIALLPIIFSFVCTLGTMKLIHHPLDIPGLMLSIVILGMGIDYSLYLVRSSQRYIDEFHPFQSHIRMAILLASISTGIGFGALSLSEHALLRSMGLSSLLGIGYALIGTFMILPPLLRHFFLPVSIGEFTGTLVPGSRVHRNRVMKRYQSMETYPRMFAWFKMTLDPMFPDLASLVKSPETIIDIGSGFGIPIVWLLEIFPDARVYCIEPDIERVRIAARAIGDRGSVIQGSAPDVPDVPVPADVAVMLDMMHYLTDDELKQTLQKLRKRLRQEGSLIIRVTIPLKEPAPWYRRIETIRLKMKGIRSYYRSADEIEKMVSQAGFKIDNIQPSGPNREETWFMARLIMDGQEKV